MATIRPRNNKYQVIQNYTSIKNERRQWVCTCNDLKEAERLKSMYEYALHELKRVTELSDIDIAKKRHELNKSQMLSELDQLIFVALGADETQHRCDYLTVDNLFADWFKVYGYSNWKPKTLRGNLRTYNNHIKPHLGNMLLKDVTAFNIDLLFNILEETNCYDCVENLQGQPCIVKPTGKKLSSSVLKKVFTLLNQAFQQAADWDIIEKTPVRRKPPKVVYREIEIWSPEQISTGIKLMKSDGLDLLSDFMHTLFIASARPGEICGLQFSDYDSENGIINISKEMSRVYLEDIKNLRSWQPIFVFPSRLVDAKSVLVLDTPKTTSSIRQIKLPMPLKELFDTRKKQYEADRMHPDFKDYNLIFYQKGGYPIDPNMLNKWMHKFLAKHPELPSGPSFVYSWRHSSASYKVAISNGDIKSVQAETGHAKADVLMNIYAKALPQYKAKLSNVIEKDFYGGGELVNFTHKTKEPPLHRKLLSE